MYTHVDCTRSTRHFQLIDCDLAIFWSTDNYQAQGIDPLSLLVETQGSLQKSQTETVENHNWFITYKSDYLSTRLNMLFLLVQTQ